MAVRIGLREGSISEAFLICRIYIYTNAAHAQAKHNIRGELGIVFDKIEPIADAYQREASAVEVGSTSGK